MTPKITVKQQRVVAIDRCLPQTQCTQCGYPRCWDYAEAIAHGEADINQCPPGGDITINALAKQLDVDAKSLNPEFGQTQARTIAVIDETLCIGCKLCIQACPVDAIVGTAKLMHTVITAECTGCELCLPPCPMDCIALIPYTSISTKPHQPWHDVSQAQADQARRRINARLKRLAAETIQTKKESDNATDVLSRTAKSVTIRTEIKAAVERVKRRKGQRSSS